MAAKSLITIAPLFCTVIADPATLEPNVTRLPDVPVAVNPVEIVSVWPAVKVVVLPAAKLNVPAVIPAVAVKVSVPVEVTDIVPKV